MPSKKGRAAPTTREEELRRLEKEQETDQRSTRVRSHVVTSLEDGVRTRRPTLPAGYENRDGRLLKPVRDSWETDLPTTAERAALRELADRIAELEGTEGWSPDEKRALRAAYVAIFGYAPGERWTRELALAIEWHHEQAVASRLGNRRRDKRMIDVPTPSDVLREVRRFANDVPAGLSVKVVERAIDASSLGRGGGRSNRRKSIVRVIETLRHELVGSRSIEPAKSTIRKRKSPRRKTR